jgi:tripeptide aminopeptidase
VKPDTGSTDSNIPFALGIPAITLGVGGKSGKIHTPEEWYDVSGVSAGLKRTALLLVDLLDSKQ